MPLAPAPADPAPARLLIVDADRAARRTLRSILAPAGYVLDEAASSRSALARGVKHRPDLVLIAADLPGPDGAALAGRLGPDGPPPIFLLPDSRRATRAAAFRAGASDCLPKPFVSEEVIARVRHHLAGRPATRKLDALVAELTAANAAQRRLLGMVAHDLRNPLSSIRGLAEFLRDGTVGPLSADQRELVETIHGASQSMFSLVNDLLDLATIEAGELKLALTPCPLAELVGKAVHLAAIDALKKKINLYFTPPRPGPTVAAEPAKLGQVVSNLLSNAVKYSPPGSAILVELVVGARECRLSVKDQGPGIPEEERGKLFQDFGRLSVAATGGEKSTGLGLAICRKIVVAHGGTIAAENLPEGGCEYRVILPLAGG